MQKNPPLLQSPVHHLRQRVRLALHLQCLEVKPQEVLAVALCRQGQDSLHHLCLEVKLQEAWAVVLCRQGQDSLHRQGLEARLVPRHRLEV